MKTHTVAFLVAVLVFVALVTESDCFHGPFDGGKRPLGEKV